ncbi:MAG: hypothetical protein KBT46_04755 [Ruminococcus sp.]|nr:hypothetical protein [Candidatus Copronaster equi]
MAKKEKANEQINLDDVQKRLEKVNKAIEAEKTGKRTAASIIGGVVLIFFILLVIILKMNGVGKVVVFDTVVNNGTTSVSAHTEDASNVEASNVVDYIAEKINQSTTAEEK